MYVTPSERGTGTAVLLVRSIGNGQGTWVDEVYLHVGSSVLRARAFYEKVGFDRTERVSKWSAIIH